MRLPEYLVERLKTDAQKVGLGTSDWVTSLLDEPRNDFSEKVLNESFDRENTNLRSEIELLRAEREEENRIGNLENRISKLEKVFERKSFFQCLFSGWRK